MYPTITDLLKDLFGLNIPLPIQTFGFFVMIAFLVAAYFLQEELKRKHSLGELPAIRKKANTKIDKSATAYILPALTGFLIGFKILEAFLHYNDLVNNPQEFILSFRGNFIGGFLVMAYSIWIKYSEDKKAEQSQKPEDTLVLPHHHVGNIVVISVVAGFLGAKIFHNLENMQEFIKDPIESLISFSGLTFYGGLIFATIALYVYCTKNRMFFPHVMDAAAPALILAYAVGRIGCHMSGDGDWGIENIDPKPDWLAFLPDWLWAYNYPNNVINEGIPIVDCVGKHCYVLPNPVFPTPLYETFMATAIFVILWILRKKLPNPLQLFSVYLFFNGLERLLIEQIRVNTEYDFLGGITQAEIIASIFIITGLSGFFYFKSNNISPKLI